MNTLDYFKVYGAESKDPNDVSFTTPRQGVFTIWRREWDSQPR